MRKFIKLTREEYDELLLCKKVVDDLFNRCDFFDNGNIFYFECSNNILRALFPDRYKKTRLEREAERGEKKNV